jgi:hypothetical protein
MGYKGQKSGAGGSWRVLFTLLCVLLVMVAGTVQVAHTHADGADTHADCSLCAAAHITVHMVQTPTQAPPVAVVAVSESEPLSVLPIALSTFALFTRPPPVAGVSA